MNAATRNLRSARLLERTISKAELANFLRRLGLMYESPRTGNPALSVALLDLADSLARADREGSSTERMKYPRESSVAELQKLDAGSVAKFLSDGTKTKPELIELASARFSIPRARLTRMSTADVREVVRAALLHEDSLAIIGDEARRSGASRAS
jgi:hypothetical protein